MEWIRIDIEKLISAPWNYKTDDPILSEKLRNNIRRNGQIENLIVRELDEGAYEVVNGNHRLTVLHELGFKDVFVCNLGRISTKAAQRVAIETNETRFDSDPLRLAGVIKEILTESTPANLLETVPFTIDDLNNMATLLDFDWDRHREKDGKDFQADGNARKIRVEVERNHFPDFLRDLVELAGKYHEFVAIEWKREEEDKST